MTCGAVIRAHRKRAGYTQEQLAPLVGVTGGAVAQWESGRIATPSRDHMAKLDDLLQAGGEILAACGYVTLPADTTSETDRAIDALLDVAEALMDAEIERRRGRLTPALAAAAKALASVTAGRSGRIAKEAHQP